MELPKVKVLERREPQEMPVGQYFSGAKSYYDAKQHITIWKIFSGDCHVSVKSAEMFMTILGSCVSACIRDPVAGIGGMNHFLLPGDEMTDDDRGASTRYGVFAMESLINGLLNAGGRKDRFEIKVFGGGNVTDNSARIGSKNARFIRSFLRNEGFRIASEDLEGEYPRRLHYYPDTGKVMLRHLRRKEDRAVVEEEARYTKQITTRPLEGDIELF